MREKIRKNIREFYRKRSGKRFTHGITRIQYAGALFDGREVIAIVDAILDGWFGLDKKGREFELMFSEYLGVARTVLTNLSGNSLLKNSRSQL